jgi:hypothetical protein
VFALICGGRDIAGKSPVKASDGQRAALEALAGSRDRGEADRARAILLTLDGWTSARIAEVFRVPPLRARGRRTAPRAITSPKVFMSSLMVLAVA